MISIIAAVDKNFLMGDSTENKIPWYLPADFIYFKKITLEKTVVMGSKTYFSLPEKFRPLPGRKNIVLSQNKKLKIEGVEILDNIEKLEKVSLGIEIFVIGGAEIYKLALEKKIVDRIYLTEIEGEFEGDVFFPKEFLKNFQEISRIKREKDNKNSHNMNFVIYKLK